MRQGARSHMVGGQGRSNPTTGPSREKGAHRLERDKDVPPGVYDADRFPPGCRVKFYLPNAGGECTGTIVRVIDRASELPRDRAPVGEVSKTFPEFLVAVDSGTAGHMVELTGAALTKLP